MSADEVYLRHILDAIEKIQRFTAEGQEAFESDDKTQDAVIRNFEVVGEAVKNLSPDLRKKYPHIEWSKIAGMRDKLIHHYFGVNLEIVWNTVTGVLPGFQSQNCGHPLRVFERLEQATLPHVGTRGREPELQRPLEQQERLEAIVRDIPSLNGCADAAARFFLVSAVAEATFDAFELGEGVHQFVLADLPESELADTGGVDEA